jgi:catechol 2,3-dioxygenase-like lactoylglutathione lyase family enzyme
MADFPVTRLGTNLAVADVGRSVAFYTERLGFEIDALYDDPPFAIVTRAGARLSFAEQGFEFPDRPGVAMTVTTDPSRPSVVMVLEVADAATIHRALRAEISDVVSDSFEPPWGGFRFFVTDPDGYLVEIEQFA